MVRTPLYWIFFGFFCFYVSGALTVYTDKYFTKVDMGGAGLITAQALRRAITKSLIRCSGQCIRTFNCKYIAHNNRTYDCYLFADDDSVGTETVTMDTDSGEWIYFTSSINVTSASQQVANVTCPENWVAHGSSCYYITNIYSDWIASNAICDASCTGAHLAIITSEPERQFSLDLFENIVGVESYIWIGANDISTPGTFHWIDGEVFAWTEWMPPPENFPSGDCIVINTRKYSNPYAGQFGNLDCANGFQYLCEIEYN